MFIDDVNLIDDIYYLLLYISCFIIQYYRWQDENLEIVDNHWTWAKILKVRINFSKLLRVELAQPDKALHPPKRVEIINP